MLLRPLTRGRPSRHLVRRLCFPTCVVRCVRVVGRQRGAVQQQLGGSSDSRSCNREENIKVKYTESR